MATADEPWCRAIDGQLLLDDLAARHVEVVAGDPRLVEPFRSSMRAAIEEIRSEP
ncbi:MAG: hypothetical protein AAFZ07_13790 [Actinomycetota bacterium]